MNAEDIKDLIRRRHDGLSPQLQRAARHILDHPEAVALTSMRRLAEAADVQPSTMVRLAHALGFDGFEEMREPFRDWLKGADGAFSARARSLHQRRKGEEEDAGLLREMVEADHAGLTASFADGAFEALRKGAKELAAARCIYVLGLRSSYAMAFYFNYMYRLVRADSVLIEGAGGTFADVLRKVGPGDALLVFGTQPVSRETVSAVEFALGRGAKVIAVTDSPVSPVATRAHHVMTMRTGSPGFFHSLVPGIALVQMLVTQVLLEAGEPAVERIRAAEAQLKSFDAYWNDDGRRRRNQVQTQSPPESPPDDRPVPSGSGRSADA